MDFSLKGVSKLSLVGMSIACLLSFSVCPRHPATWTPRPPYGSTIGTNDFDLSPASTDPNGAPNNPRWAPQVQQSTNLPPTTGSECIKKNGQQYQSTLASIVREWTRGWLEKNCQFGERYNRQTALSF